MRAGLIALALMLPGAAMAQQRTQQQQAPRQDTLADQVERNIRTCIGSSQDMALIARCMDSQRAVVAPRLETAVERLLATQADPARRDGLMAVQAAWANYRNLRCDFAGSNPERGAEAAADRAACLLQFDLARTLEIEAFLQPPPPTPPQPQRQQQRR
ncbi:DUF1311 domain-containing protein [Roseomonas sp. HJA6]|uniref:DUF1311 domain-containing protein n=1 Tax=Roseomonas alba TaxID=2846776 RepID=A0ABS7A4J4_9PROT|nr:lysozyme inhibitor LprI family protein [Neoroseomonas alba]MBW6397198.1 DUF1311 domain-containing protein [Neoroseomonas alba]